LFAVACLDYYFTQPLFHFYMTDMQEVVSLGAFEVTTIVISRLSAKELRSSREAAVHRVEMKQLYELCRDSLLMDLHQAPGSQLVVLLQRIFVVRAVALYDVNLGRQDRAGDWNAFEENIAKESFLRGASKDDPHTETSQRILLAGPGPVGALVIRGQISPLVIDALASLAAIAVNRHQSFENEERAENASKSEQLRAAVMDALAHEFKTPLTAMQTSSSGLLALGGLTERQQDLVTLIDDETTRLNELCTRLLMTARLDTEQVSLKTDEVNVIGLISEVLAGIRAEANNRIQVAVDDQALTLRADRGLLAMILTQYLDNALKYSIPDTPIKVAARKSHSEVLISVHNYGSTIRIEDRERIFDRFYRSHQQKDIVPGTGIGLSVVRKAAEAHHGHVWVISDDKEGTTFYLSLPTEARRNL
jgi:two-component system sensor histidine kinase KdpD